MTATNMCSNFCGKQASVEARGGITTMNMESRQVLRLEVESPP